MKTKRFNLLLSMILFSAVFAQAAPMKTAPIYLGIDFGTTRTVDMLGALDGVTPVRIWMENTGTLATAYHAVADTALMCI